MTELAKYEDKFDTIVRAYRDRTGTIQLSKELENQVESWSKIREHIREFPELSDTELLTYIVSTQKCSQRTAYTLLNDTRRFFSQIEAVNLEFEKVMLIHELKNDIKQAKAAEKWREVAMLRATLAKIVGADKPTDAEGGRNTIINILNYNPQLIGAKEIPNIDGLIQKMIADDEKRLKLDLSDDE